MKLDYTNKAIIGVDLGGTNVRAGKVRNGKIEKLFTGAVPTEENHPEPVIAEIIKIIRKVFDSDIQGIGMGIPSLLDRKTGVVYDVQNIPSWHKVYLKEIMENEFNVPVFLDNDANCFALGERIYGKGQNYENFVGITLGTGIGAGIVNRGMLYYDNNCGAGEFGMIPYLDSDYETYCSGKFFKRFFKKDGQEIYQLAQKGDSMAIQAYREYGHHLGNIVKTIMYAVDPEMIIFGGSIAKARGFFEEFMFEEVNKFAYRNSVNRLRIEFSELEQSAILGASAIFFNGMYDKNLRPAM